MTPSGTSCDTEWYQLCDTEWYQFCDTEWYQLCDTEWYQLCDAEWYQLCPLMYNSGNVSVNLHLPTRPDFLEVT